MGTIHKLKRPADRELFIYTYLILYLADLIDCPKILYSFLL